MAETNGIKVRMMGMNRPKKIAIAPYLSKKVRALDKSFSLMNFPKIRWRGMISPNLFPKKKLSESPPIEAARKMKMNRPMFNPYVAFAESAAAANNNESPGRNGKITAPVSIKMIANKIR